MYAQVCFPVAFPTNHHPLTPHGHANPAANHIPSHPNARTKHQSSPQALLDGTGLLQMPLQRAESPETMQDNCSNWNHMRHTRSHKRQHEPNETPRHSATHTPAWKQQLPTDRSGPSHPPPSSLSHHRRALSANAESKILKGRRADLHLPVTSTTCTLVS